MMKRAFLLSMDAMIAVGILFILASFIAGIASMQGGAEIEYQRLYFSGKDAINVIERVPFSAAVELFPENFTVECNITQYDMDRTVLDVIGHMWAQNTTTLNDCARNVTRVMLSEMLPEGFGYEILMDGVAIDSQNAQGSYVSRLNTIVSGYELGKPVSGYFASAYIARIARSTSSYVYFGGYEGDGNITKILTLPEDANVTYAYLEANVGDNFTLYVNGNEFGPYTTYPQNFSAQNWTVCTDFSSCSPYFIRGENIITVNFTDMLVENYVGGGFLKVTYNTSRPDARGIGASSNRTYEETYRFPGVNGIINIYSGMTVPGTLQNMTLHLHYNNSILVNQSGIPVFLVVGATEVFRSNASGDVVADMDDAELRAILDYTLMSNATIPLRLGMETFHVLAGVGSSDVVLITDRSGSMGTCDVWSNASYDCLGSTCEEICSATCDTETNCMNVCDGTWTPTVPGSGICTDHSAECCDNATICGQCGGTYGWRDRINVAKDADADFIDTVLGFEGSRAGLAAYGTEMCSYDGVTENSTLLQSRVSGYADDCGGTCICCGINKATDLITKSNGINALSNSDYGGPSIAGWGEEGAVGLSSDISAGSTLEFEGPNNADEPDMVHVSGNTFAIAYETTADSTGWVKTVQIYDNGTVGPVMDSLQYDATLGEDADIIHVSGSTFAIAHRGAASDGFVTTVDIYENGTIGSVIDDYEFLNEDILDPDMAHVSGNVYAVAYSRDSDDDGFIVTFTISPAGVIGTIIDTLEFDAANCQRPSVAHVTGNIFAIAYEGSASDGFLATVDIDAAGNIGSVMDSYEYLEEDALEPSLVAVSSGVVAVAYRRNTDDDGYVRTVRIGSNGAMESSYLDYIEFDASNCYNPSMVHMYEDYYAVAYRGPDNDGWLKILQIEEGGEIADAPLDSIEFQASDTAMPRLLNATNGTLAVAYRYDSDDDGYVTSVMAGNASFGLYDYWYVDTAGGSAGSLSQNFTLPTGDLLGAYLILDHGTDDTRFDGDATANCNITYPLFNGTDYASSVATVWSESWTSATNPAGAVREEVNVTSYIETDTQAADFNYTLECGASVSGGDTTVAFDNIVMNFTMERYKAMLVMSDGAATLYCESFTDFTGSGTGGSSDAIDESWAINASCRAREQGIDVYSVAFGSEADEIVMQQIACWNCTTNNWNPGEEGDNCSKYYASNNAEELQEVYANIAQNMGEARYEAQSISVLGDVSLENILYPDSAITFNYTPASVLGYGEVAISLESERFGGIVESPKAGSFFVPDGSRVLDAQVASYSSGYWTSTVTANNSMTGGLSGVYNASSYGNDYTGIGDPFVVSIPAGIIVAGENNTVHVDTGLSPSYSTGGSPYNVIIYHVGVEGLVGYGDVYETLENATTDARARLSAKLSGFNITMLEVATPYQYVSELPSLWGPSVMEIRVWS